MLDILRWTSPALLSLMPQAPDAFLDGTWKMIMWAMRTAVAAYPHAYMIDDVRFPTWMRFDVWRSSSEMRLSMNNKAWIDYSRHRFSFEVTIGECDEGWFTRRQEHLDNVFRTVQLRAGLPPPVSDKGDVDLRSTYLAMRFARSHFSL
jgi:hypothetical protein